MSTSQQVNRVINAPAAQIFDLLAQPGRHTDIDGAGTLRGLAAGPDRIRQAGESFVMNMNQDPVGDYQMKSDVVDFEEGQRIAWAPSIYPTGALAAALGDSDITGHTWAWNLNDNGDGTTEVNHVYDWSAVTDPAVLPFFPNLSVDAMEGTLDRISQAVNADR